MAQANIWDDVDALLAAPPVTGPRRAQAAGSAIALDEAEQRLNATSRPQPQDMGPSNAHLFDPSQAQTGDIALPSVWDDVDALLAAPPKPPIAPARKQSPAGADRYVPTGLLKPGNVNLSKQPRVQNPDGTTSTVDSRSFNIDGREVLLPSVTPDGRHLATDDEIVAEFKKTGRHLGMFDRPESATAHAEQLHNDYAAGRFANRPPPVAAQGYTDPASVRITEPKPPPPVPPRLGSAKTGGFASAIPDSMPVLDTAQAGPPMIAAGVRALATRPEVPVMARARTGALYPSATAPVTDDTLSAASSIIEGIFKTAEPVIVAGAVVNPVATAFGLTKAVLADKFGAKGAELLGASPEGQRLAGNVAALLSGTVSARDFVAKVRADVRAVTEQARVFDAANPDLAPVKPAPAGTVRMGQGEVIDTTGRVEPVAPAVDIWKEVDRVLETPPPVDVAGRELGGYAGPERRVTPAGPPPAGLEERRLPADQVRADLRDNPDLVRQADEMKRRADAAREVAQTPAPEVPSAEAQNPRAPELAHRKPESEIQLRGAAGSKLEAPTHAGIRQEANAGAAAGTLENSGLEERPDAPSGGTLPEGQRPAGGRPRERAVDKAAATRAHEDEVLGSLVEHARAQGYAGDHTVLHRELRDRLDLVKDLDAEFESSGRNPDALLKAIADAGGISVKAETGQKGEITWLKEFRDTKPSRSRKNLKAPPVVADTLRGVRGVFRNEGLTLDGMVEALRQEPRFQHIESITDLVDEIRAAATAERDDIAINRLRDGLGERWWESIGQAADLEPIVDTLDTGETQTRLPDAGGARQVGKADTTFRAPVQATGDDFARQFLGENDVPIEVEGDLFNDEPGSSGMPAKKPQPPVPMRAGASASRGFFGKQELPAKRATTLPATRYGRKVRVLPVAEIVEKLSDLFGRIPVSEGKLYKGYLGVYMHGPEVIRVQVAEDLHVIAHEMGHHLDMAIMEGSVVFNRGPVSKELKALGAPTSLPSYTPAQQRREGTAEFFRRWLTDPDTLPGEAPKFTAMFEQYLDRHPKIAKGLRDIRNDVHRYIALPADEQARLHIDFEGGGRQVLKHAQQLGKAATTPEGRARVVAYLSSQWMDDLAFLRLAEESLADGRPVDITESAYAQARLARGHAAKAEGFLAFGVRDVDGTFIGPSFDDAIAPVYHRLEDFALYAAAKRADSMHKRGKESGFTRAQIDATLEKFQSPEFDAALKGLRNFHTAKLDYMVRSGALSFDQAAKMLKLEPHYIPYQRIQDTVGAYLGGKKLANRGLPVKRLKGSGRRIANPLETVIRNTHAEVSLVESNKAMLSFVHLALKTQGHGVWIEEIPEPQVATRFKLNELTRDIREILEKNDIELPDGGLTLDEMLDELVTVFTPQQFVAGNTNVVTVIENGKRRWFEVHDKGLYEALTAVGPRGTEEVIKLFWRGMRVLRKTAVSTVGFVVRNPIKDQLTATVQSRAGYRPGIDFMRGLFHYLKKDELYQLYVNSLADQATMVSDDRDLLRKRLRELGKGKTRTFLDHTVLGPFDGLQALSHAGESATRIGEFARTLDRGGEPTAALLMQAALNARDVSQDFQRAGKQTRAWNNYVAFFSARVGGYGRMWESFHENPTRFLWKALTSITLTSLLLWIVNREDEEYNELPAWERNYYWHVPVMNLKGERTGFARVPKPFELGQMFGTATELGLEMLTKDDPAIAGRLLDRRAALQLVLQITPTAILPWLEVAANYDYFRDRYIVSPWQEDLAAPLQYNRWTSETAKGLGELLDLSPAKIDTLIYGYTAGVGQGVMDAVDIVVGSNKPSGGAGRLPGIGALYRPLATSDAQSLADFFTARDALAGLKASVKQYRDAGREDRAQALLEKNRKLAPFEASVPAAERRIKELRGGVNQVFADPMLTPKEKRQALDRLYLAMLNLAREGLGKQPLSRKPPPPVEARPVR